MSGTADEIAADLRRQIQSGELRPGDKIPAVETLAAQYGVAGQTSRRAINRLKAEGLVVNRGGRSGNRVRERPTRRMARGRAMQRDHLGYYSGDDVQHWRPIPGTSTSPAIKPVPPIIAELLGVQPGSPVLVRERMNGDPEKPEYRQIADSWLHPDVVAELPVLAGNTGPGGTYDRIEEWADQPLKWTEEIVATSPSPDETKALLLPPGVPMLRVLRVSTLGRGKTSRVVEVQDIRMSGELFSVRYPLPRQGAARWPVQPAIGDYYKS